MAKSTKTNGKIDSVVVRMYCMGTGDCFILKFFDGKVEKFTMMIDCGVWSGSAANLLPFMEDLKSYVNGKVDLLVVTHEHKDHVSVFEACSEVFTDGFEVGQIWMGWTENDQLSKVKKWKTDHGDKKKALFLAAEKIDKVVNSNAFQTSMKLEANGFRILGAKQQFASALSGFSELHVHSANGTYIGPLEGMRIVKQEIAQNNIEYLFPGDIKEGIPGLDGIRFYVLGPPENFSDVETEGGEEGESYTHNKILRGTDAFAASILGAGNLEMNGAIPFESSYEAPGGNTLIEYKDPNAEWRKIDNDWLFAAGSLALRMNSLTNNLSLALAIEFEDSKRVMLFPGDAEYGSWTNWHKIDWQEKPSRDGIHFTEDLLNRTVFYKVAHHMSHNGTAQRLGLNMMTHKDLVAMASLDYDVIAPAWKNTMPNQEMIQELLKKTKGRVMIMNEGGIFFDFEQQDPITGKIKAAQKKMNATEAQDFKKSFNRDPGKLFVEYTVKAK